MALPDDLLEQTTFLARDMDPGRPRQASLRRTLSAAYYALFHLLSEEGAGTLAPRYLGGLRHQVKRAFAHADMRTVCEQFARGGQSNPGTRRLVSTPIEPQLVSVASAFVALQESRHAADYDTAIVFNRLDVLQKITMTRRAFAQWRAVRRRPNARVFLAALLLQQRWAKT